MFESNFRVLWNDGEFEFWYVWISDFVHGVHWIVAGMAKNPVKEVYSEEVYRYVLHLFFFFFLFFFLNLKFSIQFSYQLHGNSLAEAEKWSYRVIFVNAFCCWMIFIFGFFFFLMNNYFKGGKITSVWWVL